MCSPATAGADSDFDTRTTTTMTPSKSTGDCIPATGSTVVTTMTPPRQWTIAEVKKIILSSENKYEDEEDEPEEGVVKKEGARVIKAEGEGTTEAKGKAKKRSSLSLRRQETRLRRAQRKYEIVRLVDRRWNQRKVCSLYCKLTCLERDGDESTVGRQDCLLGP